MKKASSLVARTLPTSVLPNTVSFVIIGCIGLPPMGT